MAIFQKNQPMKRFYSFILACAFFAVGSVVQAQTNQAPHKCAAETFLQQELQSNPGAAAKWEAYQERLNKAISEQKGRPKSGEKRIIPVVFHIIHQNGPENISRQRIQQQIQRLNEDFSKSNASLNQTPEAFRKLAADCQIEFRLATKDDLGRCTDGIVRVYSKKTVNAWNGNEMKALSYWNSYKYLNIWVVESIYSGVSSIGGQVLGYAQFPAIGLMSTDGIVLRADCVGNASQRRIGRTATHEIGHWLGLRHIWGDAECGSDDIDDTPIAKGPNFDICWNNFPHNVNACQQGDTAGLGEMFMNYMDYSDDNCMSMFTKNQKDVMDVVLSEFRVNLWSPANLAATGTRDEDTPASEINCRPVADFIDNRSPDFADRHRMICQDITLTFDDQNKTYNTTSYDRSWEFEGGSPATSTSNPVTVTYETPGRYDVKLTVSNDHGSSTKIRSDYVVVSSLEAEHNASSYMSGFELADDYNRWIVVNQDGSPNRWERVSNGGIGSGGAFRMRNFDNTFGEQDQLISPSYNLDMVDSPVLMFRLSGAERGTFGPLVPSDRLELFVSTNCGQSWSTRASWSWTGLTLVTSGLYNSEYTPGVNDRWISIPVSMTSYQNEKNVRFRFQFTAGTTGSNNIYIDDVQVGTALGLNEAEARLGVALVPNPAREITQVYFNTERPTKANIVLYDITGKQVAVPHNGPVPAGEVSVPVQLSSLPDGIYMLKLEIDGTTVFRKLVKG